MTELSWLQQWYSSQCNGAWEHSYGVRIDTIDNPGWDVRIDLKESGYATMPVLEMKDDRGDRDWIHCEIKDGEFRGHGDPLKLERIIETFHRWVEANGEPDDLT